MAHPFDPQRVLIDLKDGRAYRNEDARTGTAIFGTTGSGKTSGPGRLLASTFLSSDYGGVVLCAKLEERRQWEFWAHQAGREKDLIIIEPGGSACFNPLDWQALQPGRVGLAAEVVSLLMEMAAPQLGSKGGDGENRFFRDSLRILLFNLVQLAILAGYEVSLLLLRMILSSAPQTLDQAADKTWKDGEGACARLLREAEQATSGDPEIKADYEECRTYWTHSYAATHPRTRSIFDLEFGTLISPLVTMPLRPLFAGKTTVTPEDAFQGRILLVDIPVQEFRLAGRLANIIVKYCFQLAVMRRRPPGNASDFLRPVFLWMDEAQNFVTHFDAEYQAVARSAGGCSVLLFQNREILLSALGSEAHVDALLGNLSHKWFTANSSPETNSWAAELFGHRYVGVTSTSWGRTGGGADWTGGSGRSAGVQLSEDRRFVLEPSAFSTLKTGGAANDYRVEAFLYAGGKLFPGEAGEGVPFKLMTIRQR